RKGSTHPRRCGRTDRVVVKGFPLHGTAKSPRGCQVMIDERPLTDGTIALLNLEAQIDALDPEVRHGRASVETRAGLTELISLRGLILGRIADYDRAEEIAEQLVRDAPMNPKRCSLVRERTPDFIDLAMPCPTSIGPRSWDSMPKQPMVRGRQSSRLSDATMSPLSCEKK